MPTRKGDLQMDMVKIHIRNKAQSAKAFETLMHRGRVDCYRGNVYSVPEDVLAILQKKGIHYKELERKVIDLEVHPE
ncbi:MAG TPA: hypothetical protein VGY77_12845 [Gemmataceae bacterium]|nr:hypothetical protein [Gemmataceae bacterium]